MKIYFILIPLLTSSMISAQEEIANIKIDTVYNNLLNKTPKNFKVDESTKPKNKYFESSINLNSLGGLEAVYGFREELQLNEGEIKWLDEQIDQIAVAFYLEGKPILIRKVGGYEGCPDESIYKENIKGREVTILNFCFSCTDKRRLDNFIKIFNDRTNALLK